MRKKKEEQKASKAAEKSSIAEKYHHGRAVSVVFWFLTSCFVHIDELKLAPEASGAPCFSARAARTQQIEAQFFECQFYSSHFLLDEARNRVYTNCAVKDMLGPKKPPTYAQGPDVTIGFILYFMILCGVDISGEILEEMIQDDRIFSSLSIASPTLRHDSWLSIENAIRDLKIEVSSHECPPSGIKKQSQKPDITGIFFLFVSFRGTTSALNSISRFSKAQHCKFLCAVLVAKNIDQITAVRHEFVNIGDPYLFVLPYLFQVSNC